MIDVLEDLRSRWRPSADQVAEADAVLAAEGTDAAFTLHLLVNKSFGFWSDDVTVVPLPGVFLSRNDALAVLVEATREHFEATGEKVTGGYTWHQGPGEWAVFEDIVAVFPERV